MAAGTYTGQGQAAWTITGNSQYVVAGGEFPSVNGDRSAGAGAVRHSGTAPDKVGPLFPSGTLAPTLKALTAGTVRVSWQGGWDFDDRTITYKLYRGSALIATLTGDGEWWALPQLTFIDKNVTAGSTYSYRVVATDSPNPVNGAMNTVNGASSSITVPTGLPAQTAYAQKVIADGATSLYPLDEASGSVFYDNAGSNDIDVAAGIARGTTGAIPNDPATTFDGQSDGTSSTRTAIAGPNTFSVSGWFQTAAGYNKGGKIIGFGNAQTGESSGYDRQVYMGNDGKINFGVCSNNCPAVLTSAGSYNDGAWHQFVGTLQPAGMMLFVDGRQVGITSSVNTGQNFSGFWRIGGDNTNGWSNKPTSDFFGGAIDDVAIFPTALTKDTVQAEYVASGRASNVPQPPTDKYGKAIVADSPSVYYRLDESNGPTATDLSGSSNDGTFVGGETFRTASPVSGAIGSSVLFDGHSGSTLGSGVAQDGPSSYSEELWFNTKSTNGGKLIGFGNSPTGNSGSYDRHVWLENSGQISFGAWTGQANIATSPGTYNDGQWHYMVATQGADGMKVYIDGGLVATNPQTGNQAYPVTGGSVATHPGAATPGSTAHSTRPPSIRRC